MVPLRAYHNDPAVKAKHVGHMRAHQEADELIHNQYWEDGKGCAISCTVHSGDHAAYETELGFPEWLAHLEDMFFERMTKTDSQRFPLRLLEAIPVGFADWDRLYHDICAFLLRDVCEFDRKRFPNVAATVDTVIRLHERRMAAGDPAWLAAREAAWAAQQMMAARTAESAAYSAAWDAAESAANSTQAASSTRLARAVVGWAVESVAVKSAAYARMADWLVARFAAAGKEAGA